MAESARVLSDALNLFTNAIQAAAATDVTNRSSVNVATSTVLQGEAHASGRTLTLLQHPQEMCECTAWNISITVSIACLCKHRWLKVLNPLCGMVMLSHTGVYTYSTSKHDWIWKWSFLLYSDAKHVLPSYLKRKGAVGGKNCKRKKTISTWDRDIIWLPKQTKNGEVMSVIPYPRSQSRADLGACGLIGKIHLTSEMSVEEVEHEVWSVFRRPMKTNENFHFVYLQPTGGGNRSRTPQQVAKLSNAKGAIFIMAMDDLDLPDILSNFVC